MKNNIKSIIIATAIIFSGCSEDFLETKSTSKVDEDAVFANTGTAMMAVNGLHKLMWTGDLSSSAFYGGYDMLMIWHEMMGDDLIYTYDNAQFYLQAAWTGHRNITAGSLSHFYRLLQYFIANSNMIIDRVDPIPGTQDEKNNLKGQAYFYRAFAYYTMVQMYGERYRAGDNNTQLGVVMRNDNSIEPRARASVEEVYQQINDDLDESVKLLAATTVKRPNKSHINVHVARGLKARVLLTQGKWIDAAETAKSVVEQSDAKLQDDTYTTLDNRFSSQLNTEWLWGSNPTLTGSYKELTHFHGYMSNENVSYNQNTPRAINSLLYKRISDTDVRKKIWFPNGGVRNSEPRPVVPPSTNSKYANYMANKFLVTDPSTKGNRHIPFMRLPEMMLIAAEGYARAGRSSEAADALYPLAHHRDPQYVKSTKTGVELIDEVMFQRRVELWGEGFRFFDLKRLDMPLDRGPEPREGYNQAKWPNGGLAAMPDNEDPEASNFWRYSPVPRTEQPRNIPAGDKRWQWYIPENETQLNPLCEQNPL